MALRGHPGQAPLLPAWLLRRGEKERLPVFAPLPPSPPPLLLCNMRVFKLPLLPRLQAIEVGPHDNRHGPCLVHFKGTSLAPQELNAWLRDGPAACNVVSRSSLRAVLCHLQRMHGWGAVGM